MMDFFFQNTSANEECQHRVVSTSVDCFTAHSNGMTCPRAHHRLSPGLSQMHGIPSLFRILTVQQSPEKNAFCLRPFGHVHHVGDGRVFHIFLSNT